MIHASIAICLLGSVPAASQISGGAPSPDAVSSGSPVDVTAFIERVVARQRSLRSMRAEFVQIKDSDLLLDPVRSSGEFTYLAPDRVRWDYRRPEEMVVLFTSDFVTTYHPTLRRADRVRVSRGDRRFVRILAGTLPLDDLASYFRVRFADPGAPAPYRLELVPSSAQVRRRLSSLRVDVDRELLLPVAVQYLEADGDSTRYEFHRLELDPELEETRFDLAFGDEVELRTIDATSGLD